MNYSDWLISTFSHLEKESSVKIFNYVQKAKVETKGRRHVLSVVVFFILILSSFSISYVISQYFELDKGIVVAISAAVSIFIISPFETRMKQRLIQQQLTVLITKKPDIA